MCQHLRAKRSLKWLSFGMNPRCDGSAGLLTTYRRFVVRTQRDWRVCWTQATQLCTAATHAARTIAKHTRARVSRTFKTNTKRERSAAWIRRKEGKVCVKAGQIKTTAARSLQIEMQAVKAWGFEYLKRGRLVVRGGMHNRVVPTRWKWRMPATRVIGKDVHKTRTFSACNDPPAGAFRT